jgi:3-dehydroquinate dehydratase/shikimate dehydrogenase
MIKRNYLIETDRLIIREWQESDFEPFAKLTADPRVMEFFPSTLTRAESDAQINLMIEKNQKNGFCFWATELKSTQEFIGFVGLNIPGFQTHFTPCVEIGWRLAYEHWGKGYAPEGAVACLNYGFEKLDLQEIVAFTTNNNLKSRRVMEKTGMTYDPKDDFDHPKLAENHPLRKHVLYRTRKD